MANELEKKIITQLEYYFGDINLPRDKFLKETIEKNEGGWVPLDVLLTFKRLADLSKDKKLIVDAIEKSEGKIIEVSEDKEKLRRSTENPLPDVTTEEWTALLTARSAYAKGFPKEEKFDDIMEYMRTHGSIDSINMRHYLDKATNTQVFKGSITVIFKTEEECKKFLALEEVKYNDKPLQTMPQADFLAEKKKEFEARKEKKAKKANKESKEENTKPLEFPKKTIVKLSGNTIAEKLNWNDMKAKVKETSEIEVAHVDFKEGQTNGYLRFPNENEGEQFISKLTENKFKVNDFEFEASLVDEEEEKKYYVEWNQERQRRHKSNGKQFGKKRKGNFNRDSPRSKKQHA